MELSRNLIIFINFIYRILSLVNIVIEEKVVRVKDGGFLPCWTEPQSDRFILICVNGLPPDFVDEQSTPFLMDTTRTLGTYTNAYVKELQSDSDGVRVVLTGHPMGVQPDSFLMESLVETIPCHCTIGYLPLKNLTKCHYPGGNQSAIFSRLKSLITIEREKRCLYVVSYDFGSVNEVDYKHKLTELDNEVTALTDEVSRRFPDGYSTFLLTSGAGYPDPARVISNLIAPVLAWGRAVRHVRDPVPVLFQDLTAFVSSLLGYPYPVYCLGTNPFWLVEAESDTILEMVRYNAYHMKGLLPKEAEEMHYDEFPWMMNGLHEIERWNKWQLQDADNDFVELTLEVKEIIKTLVGTHLQRMRRVGLTTISINLAWQAVLLITIVRGALTVRLPLKSLIIHAFASILICLVCPACFKYVAVYSALQFCLLQNRGDLRKSFYKEGYMTGLFSGVLFIALLSQSLFGVPYYGVIILLTVLLLQWPFHGGLFRRSSKKVLYAWIVTGILLAEFLWLPLTGRAPQPRVIAYSGLLCILQFHILFRNFRHPIDVQGHVVVALVATASAYSVVVHSMEATRVVFAVSWSLLLLVPVVALLLRGTIVEHEIKFLHVLSVPIILLSVRHECFFYVILTLHLFSWINLENINSSSFFEYPSKVFSIKKSKPSTAEDPIWYYRLTFFFLTYVYIIHYASGNYTVLYSHDYTILKPFTSDNSQFMIYFLYSVKILVPFLAVVYTMIVVCNMCRKHPEKIILLTIFYLDFVCSWLILTIYFIPQIPKFSDYVLLQLFIIAITGLYFVGSLIFHFS